MSSLDNIAPRTNFCAVSYLTSKDFEALINCMFDIGYTEECALEWAHYTVLNTLLCAGDCIPDTSNTIVGNGPPPECELTSCFACAQEKFRLDDVHYQMTGYSGVKGGIIDRAPSYNCSDFQAVVYDPCVGADPDKAPTGSSSESDSTNGDGSSSGTSGAPATPMTPFFGFMFALLWSLRTNV